MRGPLSVPLASPPRLRSLALPALLGLLWGCGPAPIEPPTLRLAAPPGARASGLEARLQLLANELRTALSVEVEAVPAESYGATVEAFRRGEVQLAWFGGVSGIRARSTVDGARAIAQGTVDPHFRSCVIARAGIGVEPSADEGAFPPGLEGKSFTFATRNSTSGNVMPRHFIRALVGKELEEYFSRVDDDGGNPATIVERVQSGSFDAGAISLELYEELLASGGLDPERCIKVWESPAYSNFNWTAHPMLEEWFGEGFIDRLQDALVAIDDPILLDTLQRPDGLIEASNGSFADLVELCRARDLIPN